MLYSFKDLNDVDLISFVIYLNIYVVYFIWIRQIKRILFFFDKIEQIK